MRNLPAQEEKAGARRRVRAGESGPESRRREEQRDEAGFEEHAVGLVAGEILRGADESERKQTKQTASIARGQMLRHTRIDAIRPIQVTSISARSLDAEPEEDWARTRIARRGRRAATACR